MKLLIKPNKIIKDDHYLKIYLKIEKLKLDAKKLIEFVIHIDKSEMIISKKTLSESVNYDIFYAI